MSDQAITIEQIKKYVKKQFDHNVKHYFDCKDGSLKDYLHGRSDAYLDIWEVFFAENED